MALLTKKEGKKSNNNSLLTNKGLLWRRVVKQPFETLPMRLGVQSPAAGSRLAQPSILPRSINEYPAYFLGGKERLGKALANHPV